jgi:asparagine synthase (glutamine-hydrolysing)
MQTVFSILLALEEMTIRMCGIGGWIDWERDLNREQPVLEAMQQTLAKRGPDAAGMWVSPTAALVHRRLIVVDPAGGVQPMVRWRGRHRYILAYNGEIYNTGDLRRELQSKGYTFESYSDTEVLLVSYLEWKTECIKRFNGIFAFGIWDEDEQSLFLGRDRLGVKPLFYAVKGNAFIFGSEIKTLLANPLVKPEVDEEGLAEIFVMCPDRTPGQGVFRDVKEVKPGWSLVYNRSGVHLQQYWKLESRPHQDDLDTTAAHIRYLLEDAVQRQLVSDVPVCVLLSGGLDSSTITAFASQAYQKAGLGQLRTFSVDYVNNQQYFKPNPFETDADANWVQRVSEHCGTEHQVILVDTPELLAALKTAVHARDLPGMADVDSSLYLFCREIKKQATVAVSGESADEIFGGYLWFHRPEDIHSGTFPWIRMVRERMQLLAPELVARLHPIEYVAARFQEAISDVPKLTGEDPREAMMRQMTHLNMWHFMQILLDRKDRMSMASGLEVRVPFCDHRLAEYVWNIPWAFKTDGGMAKGILRRALRGVLPEDVVNRRKSPYPKTHNPSYLRAVCAQLASILDDPNSPLLPFVDTTALRRVVQTAAGDFETAWFSQLMRGPQLLAYFIQVDTWLRDYHVSVV